MNGRLCQQARLEGLVGLGFRALGVGFQAGFLGLWFRPKGSEVQELGLVIWDKDSCSRAGLGCLESPIPPELRNITQIPEEILL